ncbi:hypothetical protein [Spirosoma agri]|uniref:Lipoprotein n=1 Tax=Spirosoma agri TaxID=1987381 RepID=A0A6M0ICI0_9BACT|nr:hypothetical protein [Spirosoma agri]NEU65899.1 hypothetical protein [Spirosoma agri]
MQRQLIQPYFLALGMALTLASCFNEPNYSNTPAVDFKGIFKYTIAAGQGVGRSKRDSVVVTIGFKDGDGDLGNDIPIAKGDSARYAQNGGWGNYDIRTFRLINRQYVELPPTINRVLFFPDLTRGKPKGAIEGSIDFNQIFTYGTSFRIYPTKFQIRIRDRSLNVSNVVETDTIGLPFPL